MITVKRIVGIAAIALVALGLTACSGMSRQGRDTAIGAGAGAIGGAVLSGGSALGTVGGAAVGGIVGHEVGK
ncbi:MAG: glycine zipper 2TM domain-containing protein [Candidimonas sp.]|nr:MAG: glycine zipper 2TM domain-containing protein [Candidimonas sp.]